MIETVGDKICRIQRLLGGCSHKVVCRYLGIRPTELSNCLDNMVTDEHENKLTYRLELLLWAIEGAHVMRCISEPARLHRYLTLPAPSQDDGWKLDIVTGIHKDLSKDDLGKIIEQALNELDLQSRLEDVIRYLSDKLSCSRRVLASLVGIDESDLETHGGSRLEILFRLFNQAGLAQYRAENIHKILNFHVFEDLNGNVDSVASSIQQDKYEYDVLKNILFLAQNELIKKWK